MRTDLALLTAFTLTACGADAAPRPANPYDPDIHALGYDACKVRVVNPAGEFEYVRQFDAAGNLAEETRTELGPAATGYYRREIVYGAGHVTEDNYFDATDTLFYSYAYPRDAHGWVAAIHGYARGATPERWNWTWSYDSAGAPRQVDHDDDGDGVVEASRVQRFTTDDAGCVASNEYATSAGRARELITARPDDCAPLRRDLDEDANGTIEQSIVYTYDETDRLLQSINGSLRFDYSYDPRGRILRIDGPPYSWAYTYDCTSG